MDNELDKQEQWTGEAAGGLTVPQTNGVRPTSPALNILNDFFPEFTADSADASPLIFSPNGCDGSDNDGTGSGHRRTKSSSLVPPAAGKESFYPSSESERPPSGLSSMFSPLSGAPSEWDEALENLFRTLDIEQDSRLCVDELFILVAVLDAQDKGTKKLLRDQKQRPRRHSLLQEELFMWSGEQKKKKNEMRKSQEKYRNERRREREKGNATRSEFSEFSEDGEEEDENTSLGEDGFLSTGEENEDMDTTSLSPNPPTNRSFLELHAAAGVLLRDIKACNEEAKQIQAFRGLTPEEREREREKGIEKKEKDTASSIPLSPSSFNSSSVILAEFYFYFRSNFTNRLSLENLQILCEAVIFDWEQTSGKRGFSLWNQCLEYVDPLSSNLLMSLNSFLLFNPDFRALRSQFGSFPQGGTTPTQEQHHTQGGQHSLSPPARPLEEVVSEQVLILSLHAFRLFCNLYDYEEEYKDVGEMLKDPVLERVIDSVNSYQLTLSHFHDCAVATTSESL